MSVYAIGDVQGCYDELMTLLENIHFSESNDTLWFAGDLVNRGKQSLQVLRFVKSLGDSAITVLGNHDLHLLAVHAGVKKDKSKDIKAVLTASDADELTGWLRQQPVFHQDKALGYCMMHAGLPPQWDLKLTQQCADELQTVLRGDQYNEFLHNMYGDKPSMWKDSLKGWDRLRFICNSFTRVRYVKDNGKLALTEKGAPGKQKPGKQPWYEVGGRQNSELKIIFGHWSTLGAKGAIRTPGVHCIDTGCVWGGKLTALRIDQSPPTYIAINCPGAQNPTDYL